MRRNFSTMKHRIVSILAALAILFVFLMLLDPGFREKAKVILSHLSNWLGVDWGPIKRWREAESIHYLARLF
jgi:hypothetical protein